MEPKLIIVRFDETKNWDESIQEKCKVIWGYYLVDLTQHLYQCSMTPDVQGYFLYSRLDWKGEECPFTEDEMTENEWNDGDKAHPTFQAHTNWGEYMVVDCSDFDDAGGFEGEWEDFVKGQIENIQCNPIEFEFTNDLIEL